MQHPLVDNQDTIALLTCYQLQFECLLYFTAFIIPINDFVNIIPQLINNIYSYFLFFISFCNLSINFFDSKPYNLKYPHIEIGNPHNAKTSQYISPPVIH